MSVRAQTANPFVLFWQTVFPKGRPETKQPAVRSTDIASMPRQSLLLLAHCLERNDPDLEIAVGDPDADNMMSKGWFIEIPCMTTGMVCCRFRPHIWYQLNSYRNKVFNMVSSTEIENYRKTKSANYPWVW